MEGKGSLTRRTMSVSIENQSFNTIAAKNREIMNAINNRNPSSLLQMSFARTSMSPIRPSEDKGDSSLQLLLLKKTIDKQRLSMGKGDSSLSTLRQELQTLEFEAVRREFWTKQNSLKLRQLQKEIEMAIDNQMLESNNQEIYNHLLKRMKKTKIFLELRFTALNESLVNSEFVRNTEVKKQLLAQEAAFQALNAFKEFKNAISSETIEGSNQIFELQKSIEQSKMVSDRREEWKKHQETMYEEAVIEDRSAKNLKLKEGLSLHRLWYKVLTRIYQRKKEKSQQLEEAFQNVKVLTGIPEISMVVENFLTKEQTYGELMRTVGKKEVECSSYKAKIDKMQALVNNFSNKEISDSSSLSAMREQQQQNIRELLELSQKKFVIENTVAKLKNWIRLMIRKFNKILNKPHEELPDDKALSFYIEVIRKICKLSDEADLNEKSLGMRVEDNRKFAVSSAIRDLSKIKHNLKPDEMLVETDLIGVDVDGEERLQTKPY